MYIPVTALTRGADVSVAGLAYPSSYIPSLYYGSPRWGTEAASPGDGVLLATEFSLCKAVTFDQIGCYVAGTAANSVVRLGIYADSGGRPDGAPILDAGTIDSATGTALQTIAINQLLTPGLYWLASVAQGGNPSLAARSSGQFGMGPMLSTLSQLTAWYVIGVSGSLPTGSTLNGFGTAAATMVYLRAA